MVSQAPIVYPRRPWFIGWSARAPIVYPSQPWFIGDGEPGLTLVRWGCQRGSFCIPQPTLVRWGGQPGSYCIRQLTLVLGWSASGSNVYLNQVCYTVIIYITTSIYKEV